MAMDRKQGRNMSFFKQARSCPGMALLFVVLECVIVAGMVRAESLCGALVTPFGYECHDYTIQTADGFVLGMSNIPNGRGGKSAARGQPLLLFPGLQAGGDNFFWNSPELSMGYLFADAGYDVWIGNNRCVRWSAGNTKYGYNDTEFWDWTWDELAQYDIPASIDFVYNARGGTPIFYIGHSQGTMIFFASLSNSAHQTAQVRSQLRGAILMNPFIYNANVNAPLNKFLFTTFADQIPAMLGMGPFDTTMIVDLVCSNSTTMCVNFVRGLLGPDTYVDDSKLDHYLEFFPQVTSTKNFNHFGQVKRSGNFQKYDKGMMGNLISYGQLTPPLYDLSLFPTDLPLQLFAGGIDGLADPTDVQHLLSSLPAMNDREFHSFADYGHLDFIVGTRVPVDVMPLMTTFISGH